MNRKELEEELMIVQRALEVAAGIFVDLDFDCPYDYKFHKVTQDLTWCDLTYDDGCAHQDKPADCWIRYFRKVDIKTIDRANR